MKDLKKHIIKSVFVLLMMFTSTMSASQSIPELKKQVYYDYAKIDSFIWSGSFNGEKFITYPASHKWEATLNVDAYQKYLDSIFQRMKEAGMNQVNISFAQIASINVLFSGDYSKGSQADTFVQVLKNEKFLGPDGKVVDMLKLYIDTAQQAGIRADLAFGGEDASGLKICQPGETAGGQASKLVQFMQKYNIDSIDFDLEDTGAVNFASENTEVQQRDFFKELHKQLALQGKSVVLTIEGSTKWAGVLKALFEDEKGNPSFSQLFDGLNLMLYSQTQYYIDANNSDWGIEQWLDIIEKENVDKIHVGFEDHVPYESPTASAGAPYRITTSNRGQAAAQVYEQFLKQLKDDMYPEGLGEPFWWPDEGIDSYDPNNPNSVISETMVDFYKYLNPS